jgi:APA family basic amino acid/polyamine antiporter
LLLSSTVASLLLLLNYSRGLIGAFTFLLMMATALGLVYYVVVSLAELKHSARSAPAWAAIALIGLVYSLFAAFGSGLEVLFWGGLLMALGVPAHFVLRQRTPAIQTS